jgi:hypothetical protein
MTSTIIPYPKFLTKPWRCMALQAVHSQAVHRLAIHRRRHCAYIKVALPSKRPLLSHCCQAVHRQARAVHSQIAHCCCHQAVHHRCIALPPSLCRQAVHHFSVPVELTIESSIAVGSFHCCRIAVTPSIAIAVAVALPSTSHCCHNVHRHRTTVKLSIAKPLRHSLLSHS